MGLVERRPVKVRGVAQAQMLRRKGVPAPRFASASSGFGPDDSASPAENQRFANPLPPPDRPLNVVALVIASAGDPRPFSAPHSIPWYGEGCGERGSWWGSWPGRLAG